MGTPPFLPARLAGEILSLTLSSEQGRALSVSGAGVGWESKRAKSFLSCLFPLLLAVYVEHQW